MKVLDIQVVIPESGDATASALWCVEHLMDDDRFRVSALMWGKPPPRPRNVFDRYLTLEGRVFGRGGGSAAGRMQRITDRIPLVGSVDELSPPPTDIIIDFSDDPRANALAAQARLGLWRLQDFAGGPGVAETARGAASTLVYLLRQDRADAAPRCIATAEFTTKFIAVRQIAFVREKSFALLRQALARASQGAVFDTDHPAPPTAPGARPLLPYLGRVLAEMAARVVTKGLSKARRQPGQWCLMTGTGHWADFAPELGRLIRPDGNRYWADPFLYQHGSDPFLFFEDYDYGTGRGHISVGRLVDGELIDVAPALVRPYHLSYPQVFAHDGEIYMLPETHEAGRIEVWRATAFPHEWTLHATALEGIPAADSVLFEDRGAWWLFTNVCVDTFGDLSSELNLYRVSGPDLADVVPHPLNPVVVGSRTARGGGRVFRDGDRILRASQNNTHGVYGWGLNILEITRLDETGYEEKLVRSFSPEFRPGLIGCHHFDAADDRWVIDARLGRGHWAG